jgi:hypothetical protein
MGEIRQSKDTEAPVKLVSTIMIVEDEAIVAKDMENSLAHLGYTVCAVHSTGEEAIAAARHFRPDLILMDIMLQGKLDGVETARIITAELAIPIVFLTAYSDERTINRAKETNAYGYLLKPFEEREVRSTIEMALYKSAMERRLKQSREWLASILHSISDGVLTANVDGLIEFCNPVAERLTGWTAEEMTGRKINEVVSLMTENGLENIDINLEPVIRQDPAASAGNEAILVAKDGSSLEIEYSTAPLKQSEGAVTGIIMVLRDIAARRKALAREKALQKRLARAQRMESVGMLANGMAEQLRRIIGPIVDYPDLISNKILANNDIKPDLAMIQNSARKAIEILANLITLGQMHDFETEPLDINKIIDDIGNSPDFQAIKRSKPMIKIQSDLPARTFPVSANRQQLLTLVNNLVFSACSRIGEAGLIKISTENLQLGESIPGFEIIEAGEYVVLRVHDSGREMGEEEINRFFEPFAGDNDNISAPQRGGGLDTAVAYAIIKGHKAMIDIRSSRQDGNDIAVYFPGYKGPVKTTEQDQDVALHGVESILVVDDDADLRKETMGYLRSIGYKVAGARNGSEAVELIQKAAQGQAIDIAIIDMIMADDFDGLETYRAMLNFNSRQKAIIVSGFTITQRIKDAMRLGVGQCLLKPYDHEDLAKAIRKELDKPERQE